MRIRAILACPALLLALALPTLAAESSPRARVGELVPSNLSTSHPYAGIDQTFEIHHPDATYIKVHFSRFDLAPGDRLEIASPDGRERYYFHGKGYKQRGENFWGTSVLGDRVILRLQSANGGGYGFDIDHYAYGFKPLLPTGTDIPPSVCGANDWDDAACYETSFPIEYERSRSAVVVLFNGVENCTGVKIGCPNQILTNEHCVTNQNEVDVTEVRFEFQNTACGGGGSSFSQAYLGDQFIQDDFTLDYCVFTAFGESLDYDAAEFDPRLPPVGERMYITGHPAGSPMQFSIEDSGSPTGLCQVDISPTNGRGTDTDIGYFCDTTGGSSGSPVWSGETHKLIGLHHFGGCANSGVRIDLIYDEIDTIIADCCATPPGLPTAMAQTNGDNRIDLTWDDSDLASVIEYKVLRTRTSGGPYTEIATIADTSPAVAGGVGYTYEDTDVSGGTIYFYTIRSTDGEQCTSDPAFEVSATATGDCTLPPIFGGVSSINAPASSICTLELSWGAATPECGSTATFNVYRSTQSGFVPGAGNLRAAGLAGTAFVDTDQLVDGTTYYYKVRAVDDDNAAEDGNDAEVSSNPASGCTTGSSCEDNPFVDVTPDGPTTVCIGGGPELSAALTSGTGPFFYQWIRDGVPIPGATDPTYTPNDLGLHTYNVRVRADSCPDETFDGFGTQLTRVSQPSFAGIGSAVNPKNATCTVNVNWDAATTVCDGPLRYLVYRDTTSPVAPIPANLIAAGVSGTTYADTFDLQNEQTYHYLVRAQDVSTGQSDGNLVEDSAAPDGPGNGLTSLFFDDFEDAGSFAAQWSVTTGPGTHRCGEWDLLTDNGLRPTGSTGNFAGADALCDPLLPITSTTLESPSIDLDNPVFLSASLEMDVRYDTLNGDDASIEIWDGAQWVVLWTDPNGAFNQHLVFDISTYVGNSDFRVRFDYQNANADRFFSVDNVDVIVEQFFPCATAPAGPPSVPDDGVAASRADTPGTAIDLFWDTSSCTAQDYNLLYGDLDDVASYGLSGSSCSLGTSGSFAWTGVPGGDLYFLIVGTDGAGTESSWGRDSLLAERNGNLDSNECGVSLKDPTNVCP